MEIIKQSIIRVVFYILLPCAALLLLLTTTNPYDLPLVMLIVPFVLLFMIVFQSSYTVLSKLYKKSSSNRLRVNAGIIAGGVFLLALLQSIRQLSIQDLIIIICLVSVLSFYTRRIDL